MEILLQRVAWFVLPHGSKNASQKRYKDESFPWKPCGQNHFWLVFKRGGERGLLLISKNQVRSMP